ncbi:MAG: energy-dependent translational throttle protein EttA, partial [Defluviicoccus sp.]|nr:energy-dependent translational throttle protein EttA [Defluviicoccus sp.]
MSASQYVYVMRRLGMSYAGGRDVLNDISLAFLPGAKIGVLGLNGAGKSTLLRIMAGLETEYRGEAWAAASIRIGHLAQEPELDSSRNVLENVMEGVAETRDLLARFEAVSARFAEPLDDEAMNALIEEQSALQERIDAADAWDIDRKVEIAMDALRCPPGETDVATLSGGERRRVALCRLLLGAPDLLLLDEPTNHLDAESVAWLERFLHDYPGTVVAITHDRYFLDNVAGWILELDRGRGIPWHGNYSSWLEQKETRLAQEEKRESARQRTLARELEWIRATPRARQAKSKARITAYEALLAEANDRAPETAQIVIPPGPRLGDLVIEARGLTKGYGDRILIDGLDFRLPAGGIVGVIGANGAGKTTLFRMIAGVETADSGTLRIGETVVLGYVDQSRDSLDPDKSVWEEIAEGEAEVAMGARRMPSRAYVGAFNFRGPDQQKKVGQLSGGERN